MIGAALLQAAAPISQRSSDVARFFTLLYGEVPSFIELTWIDGDLDDRERYQFRRHWFAYAPRQLGERHGNVYVQRTSTPARTATRLFCWAA